MTYCLAVAAQRYEMDVIDFIHVSSHLHMAISDRHGNAPTSWRRSPRASGLPDDARPDCLVVTAVGQKIFGAGFATQADNPKMTGRGVDACSRGAWFAWTLLLCACGSSSPVTPDAAVPWARYSIAPGEHTARVSDAVPKNPIRGITDVVGRDYELVLDATAIYTLAMPTEPNDQLDWNKLPGFSDCDEIDLSRDGAMFGWRWRPELGVLEVAAYANNAGAHLTSDVLFTLDAADLEARVPIRYRVWREPTQYRFDVRGVEVTLPRRCAGAPLDPSAWAGAFYFGGTSPAPHEITAAIRERPF